MTKTITNEQTNGNGNGISVVSASEKAMQFLEPMDGCLNGTFDDALKYLEWAINVFASKGKMNATLKGKAFADAIQTIEQRFGWKLSTHYLKQFCADKIKHKNLHIAYLLNLADYRTEPVTATFHGAIVNGLRTNPKKIFDFLVPRIEVDAKAKIAEAFAEKCKTEWDARDKLIAEQKLNVDKLQICNGLEDNPKAELEYNELQELAPDLKTLDNDFKAEKFFKGIESVRNKDEELAGDDQLEELDTHIRRCDVDLANFKFNGRIMAKRKQLVERRDRLLEQAYPKPTPSQAQATIQIAA
jgi:hypothetical protein